MCGWGEFHKLLFLDRRLGLEIPIYSRSEICSNFRNTSHVSTWSKIVTVCTKCENKGFKKLVKLSISYVFQQSYHNFEVEICSWTNWRIWTVVKWDSRSLFAGWFFAFARLTSANRTLTFSEITYFDGNGRVFLKLENFYCLGGNEDFLAFQKCDHKCGFLIITIWTEWKRSNCRLPESQTLVNEIPKLASCVKNDCWKSFTLSTRGLTRQRGRGGVMLGHPTSWLVLPSLSWCVCWAPVALCACGRETMLGLSFENPKNVTVRAIYMCARYACVCVCVCEHSFLSHAHVCETVGHG